MINLQNPSIPIQQDPVEIDRVIVDLQVVLSNSLPWLTQPYGRAYKNLDVSNGNRFYYPQVYLGKDRLQPKYLTVTPDNDKEGQCFFLVERETLTGQQQGQYGFLNYNLSVIFSVNLELINSTLLGTDLFTANLVKEVREVLRQNLGKEYQLKVSTVDYLIDRVFAGLNVEMQTIEKAPLQHFRLNATVVLPEDCSGLPYDSCEVLKNNLTEDQKNNCLLPSYDFSNTITQDATTGQQQLDLTSWLCTVPPTINESLYFGGSNSYLRSSISPVYDIERTDSFTWSIWAKLDTLTSTSCLISKGNGTRGIVLNVTANGAVRPGLFSNSFVNGLGVTTIDGVTGFGDWHLYTITYNGTSSEAGLKFYYDGVLVSTSAQVDNLSSSIISTEKFRIGSQSGLLVPTAGRLFCFRQWDSVKSPAFILQEYNEKGLTPSSDTPITSCMIGTGGVYGEMGFCMPDVGSNGRLDGFSSYGIAPTDKSNDVPS